MLFILRYKLIFISYYKHWGNSNMESIILGSTEGMFKIFGLGFIAGGLFSFVVMLVTDWIADRDERKRRPVNLNHNHMHKEENHYT